MSDLTRREFLLSMATIPFLSLHLPQLVQAATAPAGQDGANQPNIIIMLFDTFSAHHLSLLGYERETTPNIARLAESATVFHNHYASGNFTSPGTASLLTGLYPWTHRAIQNYSHTLQSLGSNNLFALLPESYYKVAYTHNGLASTLLHQFRPDISSLVPRSELTLADALWSDTLFPNDYPVSIHTERLFQGQSRSSPAFMAAINKIYRNLRTRQMNAQYADLFPRGLPGGDINSLYAIYVLDTVTDWAAEQAAALNNPFALYVHVLPPHGPYRTRHDFVDVFDDGWRPEDKPESVFSAGVSSDVLAHQRRMYDEFVGYVDAEFGRLFAKLEANGTLDNTIVILTSDHGEMFERGILGHGTFGLYDPIIHIPLMIWRPGQTERVDVYERTSAVDVLPTLLHVTGQPIPDLCEGAILPTFSDTAADSERSIFALEAKTNSKFAPLTKRSVAFYQGDFKLTSYLGYPKLPAEGLYELYNLTDDPGERANLIDTDTTTAAAMIAQLQEKLEEVNRPFRRA